MGLDVSYHVDPPLSFPHMVHLQEADEEVLVELFHHQLLVAWMLSEHHQRIILWFLLAEVNRLVLSVVVGGAGRNNALGHVVPWLLWHLQIDWGLLF